MAKRAPGRALLQKGKPSSLYSLFGLVFFRSQFYSFAVNRCHTVSVKETIDLEDLVKTRCKFGNLGLDEALGLFDSMLACVGLHPEVDTLNTIACAPDAYTLNALLRGVCKYRSLSEAMELLRKIEEKGLACCEITYATIINGLCRAGKTCMALEILEQMYEDGRFKPVPQCYNPIIDRLCKESRIDEAMTLFRDMINKSVAPNIISYT
ncbi:unnamed protein product [Prunus armeniaca]|uniref:Pentacotripeptide-repeat region of PRORP domain-containing protein n=1 Tax=Prunus armeniaca TaxID=36596 RepID=A0A6J5THJ5_PRUAR|nr:unnamed protein product [Prunus armeniaca]